MLVMLALSFFSWWYGRGWARLLGSFVDRLSAVLAEFSVTQLLRTIFAPWRRIISYPGASLADRWQAGLDNLFSRVIGFIVRLLVLIIAFICLVVVALLTALEIIIWPLLPLAIPGCLIAGVIL
jgi:hypothetical protein